jgi:FdrA protein
MAERFEELLQDTPVFINIGVGEFAESLRKQGFVAVDVWWSPPAGGDREMADILDKIL